jgi:eukaryotic-like serine/threonine-protein kinase
MTDRTSAALSKSASPPDPLVGRVIGGRFKITALIARGGMGKVYRAEQSPLGRICAVKVLNPTYAGDHDPEFHKRFFLEASTASKLTHPNTVTIFDYGRTDDDVYYMAMEYLEGITLHRAIRDAGHLAEERAAHIARQICRALREAHSMGVVHRDLKPANIFLLDHGDESDVVKVLDFGLVKLMSDGKGEDLTQAGMFMGSPKYMSPEQIRGARVDARTDVYALGILLYEMLTGRVPFDRPNSVNILMAHVTEEAPAMRATNPGISVSALLEQIVSRCMAKDPERRFHSMGEVLTALKRVVGAPASAPMSGLEATERAPRSGSGDNRVSASDGPRSLSMGSSPPLGVGAVRSTFRPSGHAGSRVLLAVCVAAALAIAGVIGAITVKPSVSERFSQRTGAGTVPGAGPLAAPPSAVAPAGEASASPAVNAPPSVPSAAPARVRVSTDPDGASVKEDGVELCAGTPCEIFYKDADRGRDHKLTFARPGYRTETRSAKAGDSIDVKLTPAPRTPALPVPPRATEVPVPVPTGYKTDIPY